MLNIITASQENYKYLDTKYIYQIFSISCNYMKKYAIIFLDTNYKLYIFYFTILFFYTI